MMSILPPHIKKSVQSDIEKVFDKVNNNNRDIKDNVKPFE